MNGNIATILVAALVVIVAVGGRCRGDRPPGHAVVRPVRGRAVEAGDRRRHPLASAGGWPRGRAAGELLVDQAGPVRRGGVRVVAAVAEVPPRHKADYSGLRTRLEPGGCWRNLAPMHDYVPPYRSWVERAGRWELPTDERERHALRDLMATTGGWLRTLPGGEVRGAFERIHAAAARLLGLVPLAALRERRRDPPSSETG
jgi:hypothetical protein